MMKRLLLMGTALLSMAPYASAMNSDQKGSKTNLRSNIIRPQQELGEISIDSKPPINSRQISKSLQPDLLKKPTTTEPRKMAKSVPSDLNSFKKDPDRLPLSEELACKLLRLGRLQEYLKNDFPPEKKRILKEWEKLSVLSDNRTSEQFYNETFKFIQDIRNYEANMCEQHEGVVPMISIIQLETEMIYLNFIDIFKQIESVFNTVCNNLDEWRDGNINSIDPNKMKGNLLAIEKFFSLCSLLQGQYHHYEKIKETEITEAFKALIKFTSYRKQLQDWCLRNKVPNKFCFLDDLKNYNLLSDASEVFRIQDIKPIEKLSDIHDTRQPFLFYNAFPWDDLLNSSLYSKKEGFDPLAIAILWPYLEQRFERKIPKKIGLLIISDLIKGMINYTTDILRNPKELRYIERSIIWKLDQPDNLVEELEKQELAKKAGEKFIVSSELTETLICPPDNKESVIDYIQRKKNEYVQKRDDAYQNHKEEDLMLFDSLITGLEDIYNCILNHSLRIPGFEDIVEIMEDYIEKGHLYSQKDSQNIQNSIQKGIVSLLDKNKKMNPEFANDVIKRWAKHTSLRPLHSKYYWQNLIVNLETYIQNLKSDIALKEEQKQQKRDLDDLDDLDERREILQIIDEITLLRLEELECEREKLEYQKKIALLDKFENLDHIIQQSKLSTLPKP